MYCDLKVKLVEDLQGLFEDILVRIGVKQGCPASPILFSLFFDQVQAYVQTKLEQLGRVWH
jgi:hypothetical protein